MRTDRLNSALGIALALACIGSPCARADAAAAPERPGLHASPHAKLHSPDPATVRWTDGFWAERFEICRRATLPHLRRVLQLPNNSATFVNLQIAAGLKQGKFFGNDWGDGDCYKFIEALAHVYQLTRDEDLDRLMDQLVEIVRSAQSPDGYISTQIQLTGKKRWQDQKHHELYNMGHLLTAASVHWRATGKRSFLEVAERLGDYLLKVFKPRPRELAHFCFNPSNIMGAVDLYRATGEPKYLKLAQIFVDMRGSVPGGSDQNQAAVPLRKEQEAVGHAVTASYLWCGAADVYAETGEKALLDALERLWRDVTQRKTYVTGAIGALHHGESQRSILKRWPHDSVHEAFGAAYQLPNRTAYNETCANIGHAMWARRMLHLTGEARYADVMERVLYNSMLSGIGVEGTDFFYTNPLRRCSREAPLLSNDSAARWPDCTPASPVHCFCCPPNVARTIAQLHGWACGLSEGAVWVHLYGGSVLDVQLPEGSSLRLVQQTDYPWQGKVLLTVEKAPGNEWELLLRVPGWADRAALKVNGESRTQELKPSSYAAIRRRWSPGDRIELDLPMEPVLIEAHPLVEETRGHAAVMRGPIVYCLESVDLPKEVALENVRLPRTPQWSVRHEPHLLRGVTVLETEFHVATDAGPWTGLYRRLAPIGPRRVRAKLIPYYAWCNRGPSDMTVWLPLE